VFALDEAGGQFSFDEVNARLEEADQNLLAEAVLSNNAVASREEVLAALESMRRSEEQDRRGQLKVRIKQLERAGNWAEALQVTEELQVLERVARASAADAGPRRIVQ